MILSLYLSPSQFNLLYDSLNVYVNDISFAAHGDATDTAFTVSFLKNVILLVLDNFKDDFTEIFIAIHSSYVALGALESCLTTT